MQFKQKSKHVYNSKPRYRVAVDKVTGCKVLADSALKETVLRSKDLFCKGIHAYNLGIEKL